MLLFSSAKIRLVRDGLNRNLQFARMVDNLVEGFAERIVSDSQLLFRRELHRFQDMIEQLGARDRYSAESGRLPLRDIIRMELRWSSTKELLRLLDQQRTIVEGIIQTMLQLRQSQENSELRQLQLEQNT